MMKRLENLSSEERMRDLRLFSLQKRRLRGVLINIYKHLMGKRIYRLFIVVPSERTRINGQKLKYKKFHLNIR